MDVSYSAWRQLAEESLTLKGENFSFLFDRRYTNRLNRMSKVFFEAYVRATKELAAHEDRFPSLSEIDAEVESGAVYAFKDRLTKNTEFFEEVKISGVSYLVPKAKMFLDSSGTYTELSFNFDEGTVVFPTKRKATLQGEAAFTESDKPDQRQKDKVSIEEITNEIIEPSAIETAHESFSAEKAIDTQQDVPTSSERTPESLVNVAEGSTQGMTRTTKNFVRTGQHFPEAVASSPETKARKLMGKGEEPRRKIKIAALGLTTLIIVVAVVLYIFGFKIVYYSLLLSDSSNGSFLDLNITNHDGFNDEIEMVLPPDIDKSIISRGGVITISRASNTSIRVGTSSDASVRLYLSNNWTEIPVTLGLAVPKGQDSELKFVHGDYNVKSKEDGIVLSFNCTRGGFSFEQWMRRWL